MRKPLDLFREEIEALLRRMAKQETVSLEDVVDAILDEMAKVAKGEGAYGTLARALRTRRKRQSILTRYRIQTLKPGQHKDVRGVVESSLRSHVSIFARANGWNMSVSRLPYTKDANGVMSYRVERHA